MSDPCLQCGGRGTVEVTRAVHGCDGTDAMCARVCPVPVLDLEPCDECGGDGIDREAEDAREARALMGCL